MFKGMGLWDHSKCFSLSIMSKEGEVLFINNFTLLITVIMQKLLTRNTFNCHGTRAYLDGSDSVPVVV